MQIDEMVQTMENDQAVASAIAFAHIVAAFYRTLIEDGVKEFDAGKLTEDFQEKHIDKKLWPKGHGLFGVAPE